MLPVDPNEDELWTAEDVVRYLRVGCEETVRRYRKTKGLPFLRIGRMIRYVPNDIRAWARSQEDGVSVLRRHSLYGPIVNLDAVPTKR